MKLIQTFNKLAERLVSPRSGVNTTVPFVVVFVIIIFVVVVVVVII